MKPPKGEKGGSPWECRPPPRDQRLRENEQFTWSRGLKPPDSRASLVAAAPPGRSEQNRLSPLPRVNDDAGISPFLGVIVRQG